MTYTKKGPFIDGALPALTAAFFNGLENAIGGDFSTSVLLPTGFSYDTGSNQIERYGTLRIVHFALFNSAGISPGTAVNLLAVGDRPATAITFGGTAYNGGFVPAAFNVGSDGSLTYLTPGISGTTTGIRGTIAFAQAN